MSTAVLLESLIDDAGLFPPTALDMPAAVQRHRCDQQAGEPMLTHRFLCPASRLEQLQAELVETEHVRLGLITDQGTDGLEAVLEIIETDPRLSLALLELSVAAFDEGGDQLSTALQVLEHVPTAVSTYYEPAAPDRATTG